MAGKNPYDAVKNYTDPLQKALFCVTKRILSVGGGYYPRDEPHVLALAGGSPVTLKGKNKLALSVIQHYSVVKAEGERGPWKVSTRGYIYTLEDRERNEIVAYHWHPLSSSPQFPHVHVRMTCGVIADRLAKAHLPTGRIAVEQFLRLLIAEFDVTPLRSDWDQVLAQTQQAFEDWRTWP